MPDGYPGGARHNQFEASCQIDEGEHCAAQSCKGQDLFSDRRHAQQREIGKAERGDIADIAGAAEQFDKIDQIDEHENRAEDRQNGAGETGGEIEPEGAADHARFPRTDKRRKSVGKRSGFSAWTKASAKTKAGMP